MKYQNFSEDVYVLLLYDQFRPLLSWKKKSFWGYSGKMLPIWTIFIYRTCEFCRLVTVFHAKLDRELKGPLFIIIKLVLIEQQTVSYGKLVIKHEQWIGYRMMYNWQKKLDR